MKCPECNKTINPFIAFKKVKWDVIPWIRSRIIIKDNKFFCNHCNCKLKLDGFQFTTIFWSIASLIVLIAIFIKLQPNVEWWHLAILLVLILLFLFNFILPLVFHFCKAHKDYSGQKI